MSVTAYPTLRLKLTVPQALKLRFLPAIPGTNAGNAAAAAEAAADQAEAAADAAAAATASKVDKAGDVMTGFLTLSSDPSANLHAATKQYVDSAIGGSGDVTTSGPVVATQLAGYADTTGNVIRGVTVGTGLDLSAGTTLNLDDDLSAISVLSGVNTIYYRSSPGVWTAVTVGTNLTFAGGVLSASGAGLGNVSATGTPAVGELAQWTSTTTIQGVSLATAGIQPLDGDLTALAALSGTNTIYYRSAANTWTAVGIGANLTFAAGTLSASGVLGGNVSNVGTPISGQLARWATATTIEGIDASTLGFAPLASPTFTGDPKSVTPATGDSDTSIATTAYVQANLVFYAPLASPTFTGTVTAPTPTPASDATTKVATTAFVTAAVSIPSGTLMLFQQTSAPTGWTKQTTHNDKTLRVVSGTASSGGSSAFSTVFGKTATDATTLTIAQIPSHTHLDAGHGHSDAGHQHGIGDGGAVSHVGPYDIRGGSSSFGQVTITDYGYASIGAGFANIAANGGSGSHTHPIDIRVQYVDLIIASKN